MEQDDYVIYAMELLGSLGERRAGQKMLDILKDETQNSARRLYATRALGRLHYEAALPTLLNLVEADETHRTLRYCVFDDLHGCGTNGRFRPSRESVPGRKNTNRMLKRR